MKLFSSQQSQEIDRYAIGTQGIAGILLMKRAAFFALNVLENTWPKARKIHIICGVGNNGGDGFCLGQLAVLAGYQVTLSQLGDPCRIQGDALTALHELQEIGLTPELFTEQALGQADVIVDALFGIGLNKPVSNEDGQIFEQINQAKKPVLALDIPSGLQADTGQILGFAIQAHHTCTFLTQKIGLYSYLGPETAGKIHFSSLYLPKETLQSQPPIALNHSLKYWLNQLPHYPASSHKGSRGTACLIGGNQHMMGAIQLAGLACLKSGAGLVKVISQPEHLIALTQAQPELMAYPLDSLAESANSAKAIGIGPGLGQDRWAQQALQQALALPLVKVLDADALNLLEKAPQKNSHWILTPHPAEAARLLNTTTEVIQQNRLQAVRELHTQYGGVVVLKGNGTLIYDGQQMELCTAGNAGMAVGGMGDVLTGAITGFLTQGMDLFSAACLGVSLHAHAGDALANQTGQAGVIPSDLALTMSQLLSYSDNSA